MVCDDNASSHSRMPSNAPTSHESTGAVPLLFCPIVKPCVVIAPPVHASLLVATETPLTYSAVVPSLPHTHATYIHPVGAEARSGVNRSSGEPSPHRICRCGAVALTYQNRSRLGD